MQVKCFIFFVREFFNIMNVDKTIHTRTDHIIEVRIKFNFCNPSLVYLFLYDFNTSHDFLVGVYLFSFQRILFPFFIFFNYFFLWFTFFSLFNLSFLSLEFVFECFLNLYFTASVGSRFSP